jgi:hypothetical protein
MNMKTVDISILLTEYCHAQEALEKATEIFDNAPSTSVDKAMDDLEKQQAKVSQIACQIVDILVEDLP